jgi:hypothetical protein
MASLIAREVAPGLAAPAIDSTAISVVAQGDADWRMASAATLAPSKVIGRHAWMSPAAYAAVRRSAALQRRLRTTEGASSTTRVKSARRRVGTPSWTDDPGQLKTERC